MKTERVRARNSQRSPGRAAVWSGVPAGWTASDGSRDGYGALVTVYLTQTVSLEVIDRVCVCVCVCVCVSVCVCVCECVCVCVCVCECVCVCVCVCVCE